MFGGRGAATLAPRSSEGNPLDSTLRTLVVGIAGGTGSGKTTVARQIRDRVGAARLAYLDQDAYYRDLRHLTLEQRRQVNFDHPDAFDKDLLVEHLDALKRGEPVAKPIYSYAESVRLDKTDTVQSRPLVIVEGILVLEDRALRERMDVRIYVDAADDIRLMRRLRRDTQNRGRSMEHVLGQYEATVRPMHQAFVAPSMAYADLVIPRGGLNSIAIAIVADALVARLDEMERGEAAEEDDA